MKKLIINADDFGMSHEFNLAISDLLCKGCISSASLMPNGLAYKEACKLIKEMHLDNIGVHLTLTRDSFSSNKPLLYKSLTGAKSLSDVKGLLYQSTDALNRNADTGDLKKEIKKQIIKLQENGIEITHLDNHMYSLMPKMGYKGYKLVFESLKELNKKDLGIRIANKYYIEDGLRYIFGGRKLYLWLIIKLRMLRLKGVDYCFSFPYHYDGDKYELLEKFLFNLRNGITELHFHPCVFSERLKEYNPFWRDRVQEYELLQNLNGEVLQSKYGIMLTSYKRLKK